jgi:hypothetical protein
MAVVKLKAVKVPVYPQRVSVVLPNGTVRLYGINSREGRMLMLIADPYVRFNDTRYHEDTRYDEEGK